MKKQSHDHDLLSSARHSAAHILAAAIEHWYPDTQFGIGPVIENGFYYDVATPTPITEHDLEKLERYMHEIIRGKVAFEKEVLDIDDAIALFEKKNQSFKVELLSDLKKKGTTSLKEDEMTDLGDSVKEVSVYKTGEFVDLCRGPHVANSGEINPEGLKLMRIAGAYWRGDEKNQMLTRIYGAYFNTKDELEQHQKNLEEAAARDHRKLGRELDLFVFSDLVGPGMPLYTPKGFAVRNQIAQYSRELRTAIGYQEVFTPNMNKAELFKISGHYDKYHEDMFMVTSHYSKEEFFLKPMNCPQHTQIYAAHTRSYRDLPIRYCDFATLYRDERPGELSGLTRLRSFAQDDGHAFCREDQIEAEFDALLDAIKKAMATYGMDYYIRLSLRDLQNKEKYLGSDEVWDKSESILEGIVEKRKIEYVRAEGEAAIYGPKMDLIARDALNREWQISTIQLDFNQPERFKLEYIDETGEAKTPVMIHAALVGSPDRFLGVLIEHYAGNFPVWLAPVQVKLLPINDELIVFAKEVGDRMHLAGIRFEIDDRTESLGKKIRTAEVEKVPYMVVLGAKEREAGVIAVRSKKDGDLGQMKAEEFVEKILDEIKNRKG
ncbi:MAG: threonine--tRNA ligase [Patescibacteria group bacterium]